MLFDQNFEKKVFFSLGGRSSPVKSANIVGSLVLHSIDTFFTFKNKFENFVETRCILLWIPKCLAGFTLSARKSDNKFYYGLLDKIDPSRIAKNSRKLLRKILASFLGRMLRCQIKFIDTRRDAPLW